MRCSYTPASSPPKTGTHVAERYMGPCFIKRKGKERIFDLKIQRNAGVGLLVYGTITDRLFHIFDGQISMTFGNREEQHERFSK